MESKIIETSQCTRELTLKVSAEKALEDYKSVLNSLKKHVSIPGFRKGKAPVSIIERNYFDNIKEEFYNKKINDYYKQAIEENNIKPYNQGEATKIEWEKGKELVATFKFEIMPEIQVKKYKNLEIPYEKIKFKNDMVKATLEDFRNKMANIVDAELSNTSDKISATIKFLDEKGSTTKEIDREFILGENQYSKEFNKNLTNVKIGDEMETKLFSKNQKIEDKEIGDNIRDRNFLVKINELKRNILPELNDAFAKDLEYESLIDMKTKIEEELKIKIEKDNSEILKNAILSTLIEKNPFELPSSLINKYAETLAKSYADAYKIDVQKLIPLYAQTAEFNIKSHYVLEEIKKTEKVNVSESDKEAMIIEAAKNLKMDMENYKKMYKKQIESEDFEQAIIESKLLKMIEENSKFIPYPKKENEENNKDKKNK